MKKKSYEFHIGLISLPLVQFRVVICDAEITWKMVRPIRSVTGDVTSDLTSK